MIVFVSSFGGHSNQLEIIICGLNISKDMYAWVGTEQSDKRYDYYITDCSRSSVFSVCKCILASFQLVRKLRPSAVVSTGALPGLIFGFISSLFCSKFIWVDSVANIEKLSMSGQVAKFIGAKVYTQWEHLEDGASVVYCGAVVE
jgi:UDP-N-acetylglucosamine:LPS N-acetylglucosamine transferase